MTPNHFPVESLTVFYINFYYLGAMVRAMVRAMVMVVTFNMVQSS